MGVFSSIAKAGAARSGIDADLLKAQYLEGLCVAIRRSVAQAVLKRGRAIITDCSFSHDLLSEAPDSLSRIDLVFLAYMSDCIVPFFQ